MTLREDSPSLQAPQTGEPQTGETQTGETLGLRAYRAITRASAPIAKLALHRRLKRGKEDPARINERMGIAGRARPEGAMVWIHGASVGESLSVLPLVSRLLELRPDLSFLVTTGTITSARLMAERLPKGAIHQFIPLDHPGYVQQFLDHWHPDAAIFVESEFWPNLLLEARTRAPFMALVNGRVSPKSYEAWHKRRQSIRYLLSHFDVLIAQDKKNAGRISALSGVETKSFGNLKNAAEPLPCDPHQLAEMTLAIKGRPVWLAASTHPGEEEIILQTHKLLLAEFPNLLTLLAPRHPERGREINALVRASGLQAQRRSDSAKIEATTDIYLADTLGELGLFYRLSSVALVGGSLTTKGGHNPLEPARLGCAILHGPHTFNFDETYTEMRSGGGAALVRNERDLATAIRRLLGDEKTRLTMAEAARISAEASAEKVLATVSEIIVERLSNNLPKLKKSAP